MAKLTKKEINAHYVSRFQSMFACPVCRSQMEVSGCQSLACSNGHMFDFARQGYVNLLLHAPKTKYSKALFAARQTVMTDAGLFDPLTKAIAEWIAGQDNLQQGSMTLLDTGCGEGSHITAICSQLRKARPAGIVTGAGIDIAKEGIAKAAGNEPEMIWSVADLANTPFQDKQFDVVLNILSPSNYTEFARLLKTDGYVIKVVPGSDYLKELRHAFYENTAQAAYSNTDTVGRFAENFRMLEQIHLHYTKKLSPQAMPALLQMTPLTWGADAEQMEAFIREHNNEITVDLDILIGSSQ
jgi:23S rRNA (guanine745-N1)-methyltransferase